MNNYRVVGARYDIIPKYYSWDTDKQFPYFEKIEDREWVVETENAEEAIVWLMTNHPEYFMGSAAYCITPGKSGAYMTAIPNPEYGPGNYETIENRVAYVKKRLEYITNRMHIA